MKKWTLAFISVALSLLILGMNLVPRDVKADTAVSVTASAPSNVPVTTPATQFSVAINIGDITDFYGIQFDVLFDSTMVQYVSSTWGEIGTTQISGNGIASSNSIAAGDERFLVSLINFPSGISGSGTIVTLNFLAIGSAGQTPSFTFSGGVVSLFDPTKDPPIDPTWTGGSTTLTTAASSADTLSGLTISVGTLTPTFASGTLSYTDSVSNSTTSVTVTPTANQGNATIKVNNVSVASGQASGAISLSVGSNTINVLVTGQDGVTPVYTITVTRAAAVSQCMVYAKRFLVSAWDDAVHRPSHPEL